MKCENKIDTDNPAYLCLEFASTIEETIIFTKESVDVFNTNMRLVLLQQKVGETVIRTLTVGDGITVNGNNCTVVFDSSIYNGYSKLKGIWDIINEGYRDVILDITIIKNY